MSLLIETESKLATAAHSGLKQDENKVIAQSIR